MPQAKRQTLDDDPMAEVRDHENRIAAILEAPDEDLDDLEQVPLEEDESEEEEEDEDDE